MDNYHVKFLGFDNTFTINPVAFSFFGISIRWYGIILCTGFILAFIYCMKVSKRFKINFDKFIDVIIVSSICGIIGARLYYVLFYPGDLYLKNPAKILNINEGGIAIYGGIIGAIIAGYFMCRFKKINFKKALDLASLGFLIGQAIGRWGNFFNQEAFGSQTNLPWGMMSEATSFKYVHPCFLYESIWCFLGFLGLHLISKKLKVFDGEIFSLYIAWYSTGRFFIEALRTDSLIFPVLGMKVSQIIAVIAILGSLFFILSKKLLKNNI